MAGGGFLSLSLNSDGVVRESKGCLVQNGDETSEETAAAVVTERKREKVGVRSGRAMNTTKHLWAGAIAAMVSRSVFFAFFHIFHSNFLGVICVNCFEMVFTHPVNFC